MKNSLLLTIIMLFNLFSAKSQMVESTAYDLMLKGMLSHTVKAISAKDIILTDSVIFVDSREENEFKVSHIPNAIWVGYDKLNLKALKAIPKDKKIVVYCSVGYRSEKVSEKLIQKGYTDVSNLYGGIFEWKNQENPIVNLKNEPTDSVHAYSKVWGIWLNKGEKVY